MHLTPGAPQRLTWSWLVGQLPKSLDPEKQPTGYQHEADMGFLLNPVNGVAPAGGEVNTKPNAWSLYLAARDLFELAYHRDTEDPLGPALHGPALAVLKAAGARLGDPWASQAEPSPEAGRVGALQGPAGGTLQQLGGDVERLASLLEAGAQALRTWSTLTAAQREHLRVALPSMASEAVDAAERTATPLPLTDVCVCRTCRRVLLPDSPWGVTRYTCCSLRWFVDPRAGYGALPNDFWSRFKPGQRCTLELAPDLDARGNPVVAPLA